MNSISDHYLISTSYVSGRAGRIARRIRDDERGAITAEQIVMIGAAVVGAGAVAAILWNKLRSGAESVQVP